MTLASTINYGIGLIGDAIIFAFTLIPFALLIWLGIWGWKKYGKDVKQGAKIVKSKFSKEQLADDRDDQKPEDKMLEKVMKVIDETPGFDLLEGGDTTAESTKGKFINREELKGRLGK